MVERQWTEEELITLQTMKFQGSSIRAIADELDLSWHTVNRKINLLQPQARVSSRSKKRVSSARPPPPLEVQKKSLLAMSNMGIWSLPTLLLTYLILNGVTTTVATNGRDYNI